jgi:SAM-dependent methyltransferase
VVLSLGETPLANALVPTDRLDVPEDRYPLDLAFCPACSLVQITETVPPETLFRDYVYFSSFSDTMLAHARYLTDRLARERRLGPGSLAMEVASNDGYLLQFYRQAGIPVLGIEPARNVAGVAVRERGIPTVTEFFGRELATSLRASGKRADVLHANNVLAHVADLNGFVAGIRTVLADDGAAIVEVPYLGPMIERLEFDTIYHEHLCYFSLTALDRLFRRHGMAIADAEEIALHGGSLLLTAVPEGSAPPGPRVASLLEAEDRAGMTSRAHYADFARRVAAWREEFRTFLSDLKGQGKRIAAYGAAAKGSTLLNHAGVGLETLDFVVDRSTHKQGRHMPGVHLPIRPPQALLEEQPDAVVLLTWNFRDEILAQQAEYRRRGGRFIVPIPEPHFA